MSYRPITDVWMLCRGKTGYYGTFPAGFLERARFLLGVTIFDPVLHVCGGKVKDYQSGPMKGKGLGPNDRTVDLDPDLDPDFCLDVRNIGTDVGDIFPFWTPADTVQQSFTPDQPAFRHIDIGTFEVTDQSEAPFSTHSGGDRRPWAAALLDRPYTPEDAENYAVGSSVLPNANDLLRRSLSLVRVGGRVGVLDYFFPRPPKTATLVACVGVVVGYGNRIRIFSVFERTAANPMESNVGMAPNAVAEDDDTMSTEPEPEPGTEVQVGNIQMPVVTTKKKTKKKLAKKKAKAKKVKKKLVKKRPSKKKMPF